MRTITNGQQSSARLPHTLFSVAKLCLVWRESDRSLVGGTARTDTVALRPCVRSHEAGMLNNHNILCGANFFVSQHPQNFLPCFCLPMSCRHSFGVALGFARIKRKQKGQTDFPPRLRGRKQKSNVRFCIARRNAKMWSKTTRRVQCSLARLGTWACVYEDAEKVEGDAYGCGEDEWSVEMHSPAANQFGPMK